MSKLVWRLTEVHAKHKAVESRREVLSGQVSGLCRVGDGVVTCLSVTSCVRKVGFVGCRVGRCFGDDNHG